MIIDMNSQTLIGPVAATLTYFLLWYALLFGKQSRTKYRLIAKYKAEGRVFDRYGSNDPEMLAADRAVGNTQEQMVPFLTALWLHALIVSATHATVFGFAYVVLRSVYPILLGSQLSKTQPKRVFFITAPCYLIIFYMLGASLLHLV